jgi:hypothetical protein
MIANKIDPDRFGFFLIAIMVAMSNEKSLSEFSGKVFDRGCECDVLMKNAGRMVELFSLVHMFTMIDQNKVHNFLTLIRLKHQPVLFSDARGFFAMKRAGQPAAGVQGVFLKAGQFLTQFGDDLLIVTDLYKAFKKRVGPFDDPWHQAHSLEQVINGSDGPGPSLPDIAVALPDGLHGCRVAQDLDCVNKGFEIFPLNHVCPDFLDLLVDLINCDTRAHDHTCALLLIIIWEGVSG